MFLKENIIKQLLKLCKIMSTLKIFKNVSNSMSIKYPINS